MEKQLSLFCPSAYYIRRYSVSFPYYHTFLYTRLFHFLISWVHDPYHIQYLYSLCGEAGFRLQSILNERSAQQAVPIPYRLLSPNIARRVGIEPTPLGLEPRILAIKLTTRCIVILITFMTSMQLALLLKTYNCSVISEEFTITLRTFENFVQPCQIFSTYWTFFWNSQGS